MNGQMAPLKERREQPSLYMNKSFSIFFFTSLLAAGALFIMVGKTQPRENSTPEAKMPIVIASTQTVSTMDSPEGSKTLTLEGDSLFVSVKDSPEKQLLYKKKLESSELLEIPFNTWAPDNVYVFLKDKKLNENDYLVFQILGETFPEEAAFLSIQDLFNKKIQGYIIEDVTGWAAPNLLIVNAKLIEGDNKVSFWFDIPSQSFTQLGTYFK